MDLIELKKRWRSNFRGLTLKRPELELIDGNYAIAKYESIDPITGRGSKDYFYVVCNTEDGSIADETSYSELSLLREVILRNAVGKPELIQKVVDEHNEYVRGENSVNEIYSRYGNKTD